MTVKPLSIERKPNPKVSELHPPTSSTPYPVNDGEDWKSIAWDHRLDVWNLIRFNFKTSNANEVNWYLREYVGCNVHTPDRLNWKFSSTCKSEYPVWSGKIYIPTRTVDFDRATVVEGKKTKSPLALHFQGPDDPLARVGKFFDLFTLFDISLTIMGVTFGAAFMLGAGITVTILSPWAILAGLAEPALHELRKKQMLEGFALGVVLGAEGRSNKWIMQEGVYVKTVPVRDLNYQQYGKQLQGLFNQSLILGLAQGREFNTVAKVNFFEFIWSQMGSYAKSEYADYFKDYGVVDNWKPKQRENFYKLCAGILARQIKI